MNKFYLAKLNDKFTHNFKGTVNERVSEIFSYLKDIVIKVQTWVFPNGQERSNVEINKFGVSCEKIGRTTSLTNLVPWSIMDQIRGSSLIHI